MTLAKKILKNIKLSKKQPEKTILLLYYRKEIKAEMEETYEKSEVERIASIIRKCNPRR